jgi:Na+-translocating ferredoxin:NAD+ oxidoreductase RnfD subunit
MPQAATTRAADPRIKALRRFALSISVFTILGHVWLGFEQAYLTPVVALLTAYGVSLLLETVDTWARHTRPRFRGSFVDLVNFLLPAHIAALACAMLLYGNQRLMPTVFAVTVAVSGKYIFRVRVGGSLRHMLNPSNFGIATTLIVFSAVAIAPPYHFTEHVGTVVDWLIPALILAAGTMLNGKLTHRLPLIGAWVGGFALQAVLRAVFFDHALTSALVAMTGVAFVLFTNYMITDPGTTPARPRDQVVFGLSTALVYGALVTAGITFGLFYALVIVCAARLVLTWLRERVRPAPAPASRVPAEPVAVRTERPAVPAGLTAREAS